MLYVRRKGKMNMNRFSTAISFLNSWYKKSQSQVFIYYWFFFFVRLRKLQTTHQRRRNVKILLNVVEFLYRNVAVCCLSIATFVFFLFVPYTVYYRIKCIVLITNQSKKNFVLICIYDKDLYRISICTYHQGFQSKRFLFR